MAFRGENRLEGEDEYYLTNFEMALDFIKALKKDDLILDIEEEVMFD
jgi:hypothetical protein